MSELRTTTQGDEGQTLVVDEKATLNYEVAINRECGGL